MIPNGGLRRPALLTSCFCAVGTVTTIGNYIHFTSYYQLGAASSLAAYFFSVIVFRTVHARSNPRYWSACFGAVVLVEHLVFRRGDFLWYHVEDWNRPRKLPPGIAAISSGALGVGIIVLCMDQVGIHIFLYFPLICVRDLVCGKPSVLTLRAMLVNIDPLLGGFMLQPE